MGWRVRALKRASLDTKRMSMRRRQLVCRNKSEQVPVGTKQRPQVVRRKGRASLIAVLLRGSRAVFHFTEVGYARYPRWIEIWSAMYFASCQTPQMKLDPRRESQGKPKK